MQYLLEISGGSGQRAGLNGIHKKIQKHVSSAYQLLLLEKGQEI